MNGGRRPMASFPYRLYGGALRPDAISGFNPAFASALINLYNAAPPEVQRELGLTSGFRSIAVQRQLFNKSDRSGRMVAAPGKSKHNYGMAADLYGFGLGGGGPKVSAATREWVHQNAQAQGLYFPMSYEPWHIQLARGSQQAGPGVAPAPVQDQLPGPAGMPQAAQPSLFNNNQSAQGWANVFNPQPSDWMQNTSYSGNAIAADLFAGRNPLRRLIYQKIAGLFA